VPKDVVKNEEVPSLPAERENKCLSIAESIELRTYAEDADTFGLNSHESSWRDIFRSAEVDNGLHLARLVLPL